MRPTRLALLGLALVLAHPAAARRIGGFDVEEVAPGVTRFSGAANSLVVERKDGLLVVDAQPSLEGGKALLAALEKFSKQPVRYLVLTDAHAGAAGGASAFPASTLIVAGVVARDRLADPAYDFGAETRLRAPDPAAWREPERPVPVLVSEAPFALDDPQRRVVVYPLPRAHSQGNLWVEVEQARVFAVGDIVVSDRNPYAGDASVNFWIGLLSDLAAVEDARIVPRSGPPVGAETARRLRDAFAWVRGRIAKGFMDVEPPEEIVDRALADPKAAEWFDLEARPSFARTVFERVFAETVEERRKRGVP